MKKLTTILFLIAVSFANAQAYTGKGDNKLSIGFNLQDGGRGLQLAYDFGIGKNMSFGLVPSYLIGVDKNPEIEPEFIDKFDFKARFNANLCDVIGIDKLDVYPGLNIGIRNFGGHVGARYFFTEGFGLFAEGVFPIAKYEKDIDKTRYDHLNNQPAFNIGAVFSMK